MAENMDDDRRIMVSRKEAARLLSLSTREIDEARRRGDLGAQCYGSKVLDLCCRTTPLRRSTTTRPVDGLSVD
jgi:hypothetical protein